MGVKQLSDSHTTQVATLETQYLTSVALFTIPLVLFFVLHFYDKVWKERQAARALAQ